MTGYPWYDFTEEDGANKVFVDAYQARFNETPKLGSLVGYMTAETVAAAIEKAGSTEGDAIRQAFEGLNVTTPVGEITFREIDNQATMGAFVGTTALKDGAGVMTNWTYLDGADYLPSDEEVAKLRPAE